LCPICNDIIIDKNNYHAGHIIAESKGGNSTNDNLLPICAKCNSTMSTKYLIHYWSKKYDDNMKKCFINAQLNINKKHHLAKMMFIYLIENGMEPRNIGIYKQNIISTKYFTDTANIDGVEYPNEQKLWINEKYNIFWSEYYKDFIVYENSIVMPDKYDDLKIHGYDIILTITEENTNILLKMISDEGFTFDFNNILGLNSKFDIYLQDLNKNIVKKNDYSHCVIPKKGLKSSYSEKRGDFVIKIKNGMIINSKVFLSTF
jgi:hypothetical protein